MHILGHVHLLEVIPGDLVDVGEDERDAEEAGVEVGLEGPLRALRVGPRRRHRVGRTRRGCRGRRRCVLGRALLRRVRPALRGQTPAIWQKKQSLQI